MVTFGLHRCTSRPKFWSWRCASALRRSGTLPLGSRVMVVSSKPSWPWVWGGSWTFGYLAFRRLLASSCFVRLQNEKGNAQHVGNGFSPDYTFGCSHLREGALPQHAHTWPKVSLALVHFTPRRTLTYPRGMNDTQTPWSRPSYIHATPPKRVTVPLTPNSEDYSTCLSLRVDGAGSHQLNATSAISS